MPESVFLIGGRRLLFRSDREAPAYRAFCDEMEAMIVPPGGTIDAEMAIMPRDWEEPSPLRLPADARLIRMGGRKVFAQGADFFIDFHENALFHLEAHRARGVCYAHDSLDPGFWTELCLSHVLLLLLRRLGLFFLHAGGALAPSGVACLFIGSGGCGKSTAALRLAAAGWPWFGDDGVFRDGGHVLHAFPRRAAATTWTVERLGIADRVVGRRRTGKSLLRFWPAALPTNRVRFFYPLPAIDGANRVEPLDEDLKTLIFASQSSLCETDRLIGGAAPDAVALREHLVGIRIGDLAGLPDFLEKSLVR